VSIFSTISWQEAFDAITMMTAVNQHKLLFNEMLIMMTTY